MINTSSSSSDSDDNDQDPFKLLASKDPMLKLMLLGKLKRIFKSYVENKEALSFTDRNLFRGIFVRKLKDFEYDFKKQREGLTLYERLTKNKPDIEEGLLSSNHHLAHEKNQDIKIQV